MKVSARRLSLILRRSLAARRIGVSFLGTSRATLPRRARLAGRNVWLSWPDDPALALDVIGVWLDDEYGLKTIAQPIQKILDVGANVGLFTLWARHHFRNATIHAYEPDHMTAAHLRANVNQFDDVEVFEQGVSKDDGRANLNIGSSSRLTRTKIDESGAIKLVGIKRAIDRMGGVVDLLKLDCEGAEWSIFEDTVAFQKVSLIRMEYHLTDGRTLSDLEAAASSIGFRIIELKQNMGFGLAFLVNEAIIPKEPNAARQS